MKSSLNMNWIEVQLIELLETLESGSRPKGGVRGIMDGVPSVGGEHLNDNGGFDFSNIKYIPKSFAEKMNRGRIEEGDTLIVKDGATTGKTSYIDLNFPYKWAFVNEHVFICRPSKKIHSKYLYWFLKSKDGNERIMENFKGSAQGGINQTFASNTLVPLAPLAEQQRIVAKLDELMEKIDRSRARLERIPKILKRFRQSILSAAVSGRLTEEWRSKNIVEKDTESFLLDIQKNRQDELKNAIDLFKQKKGKKPKNIDSDFLPEHDTDDTYHETWRVTRIKDVAECLDYIRKPINKDKRSKRLGSIPYYGANGQVGWIDDYLFDEDLVVVVEDETFIGREIPFSYIIRGKTWVNNHAHVLRPLGGMSVEYLNACLAYYNFIPLTSGTTGRRKLNQGSLLDAKLAIAPPKEQKEIVRIVEQLFAFADKIEARYIKAKTQVDKLPQSLLAKAFHDELVPQDENDEPASVLLERIQSFNIKKSRHEN